MDDDAPVLPGARQGEDGLMRSLIGFHGRRGVMRISFLGRFGEDFGGAEGYAGAWWEVRAGWYPMHGQNLALVAWRHYIYIRWLY